MCDQVMGWRVSEWLTHTVQYCKEKIDGLLLLYLVCDSCYSWWMYVMIELWRHCCVCMDLFLLLLLLFHGTAGSLDFIYCKLSGAFYCIFFFDCMHYYTQILLILNIIPYFNTKEVVDGRLSFWDYEVHFN